MTQDAQCIAIAEAVGYSAQECLGGLIEWRNPHGGYMGRHPAGYCPSIVPNYTTDLNAMHEAEKTLNYEAFDEYYVQLAMKMVRPFHATAAQRAEAFLHTLNLWKD